MAKYAVSASSRSWMNMRYVICSATSNRSGKCSGSAVSPTLKKAKSSLMLEFPYTSMFEGHGQYKWSVFRDLPAEKMYELMQTAIFPFIKNRRLPIKVS